MRNSVGLTRREFIVKSVTAISAVYIIPDLIPKAVAAKSLDMEVSAKTKWAINVDVNKCVDGCTACVEACVDENGLYGFDRPETDSQWIRKLKIKDIKTDKVTTLPMMCQHCENPPCVDVCPTGASFRREDGIVMVNQHTCIGCRYCMMACPFKARSFVHENLTEQVTSAPRGKGCVESCNLCVNRIDHGSETTACEEACMKEGHHAITFGDLADPNSRVSLAMQAKPSRRLREDLKLKQRVTYSGF